MKTLKLLTSRAGKRTILALWLLLTATAALAITTVPGSEYINEKMIRNTADQSNNPAPFKLTIFTDTDGAVHFQISNFDQEVKWNYDNNDAMAIGNFMLWQKNEINALSNYFTKSNVSDTEFKLIPKSEITLYDDARISYRSSIYYKYNGTPTNTVVNSPADHIIYTYGTNITDPTWSMKNMIIRSSANDNSRAYITASYDKTKQEITISINSNSDYTSAATNNAYFRNSNGGGFDAAYIYLRSYSTPAWCGQQ